MFAVGSVGCVLHRRVLLLQHRRIAYLLGKAQRYCDRSDDGENDEQDHNAFEALRVVHSHNMVFHIFMLLIKQICPPHWDKPSIGEQI